jgi:quercetin dioxygenase-like cupin family protein
MAYIFHENEMPKMQSVDPGRERIPFVNKDLAKTEDLLCGIMRYKKGAKSPYHYHEKCEHFYFLMSGKGTVQTEDGTREVKAGEVIFIPNEEKHMFRAGDDVLIFEFQGPYKYKTVILDGDGNGLAWKTIDGKIRTHIK